MHKYISLFLLFPLQTAASQLKSSYHKSFLLNSFLFDLDLPLCNLHLFIFLIHRLENKLWYYNLIIKGPWFFSKALHSSGRELASVCVGGWCLRATFFFLSTQRKKKNDLVFTFLLFLNYLTLPILSTLFFLDWICKVWEWPIRVQNKSLSNVWIYDQLHTQAEAFTREIHDEQRVGKFYNFIGMDSLFIFPFIKYS